MPDIFVEPNKKKLSFHDSNSSAHKDSQSLSGENISGGVSPVSHAHVTRAHKPTFRSKFEASAPERAHLRRAMFPLAAFAMDPSGVSFATQGENEEIHLFLRRHFITNIPWIVFATILIILPVFSPFLDSVVPFANLLTPKMSLVLLAFYYVVIFGTMILINFINWYFNVYIVTNERLVDVDFVNILYREVSSTRLNLIQDVTVKTGGVIRAVFDYGDVFIQTAGTETNFDFHAVPHAQQVAREIEKLMELARNKEGASDIEKAMER